MTNEAIKFMMEWLKEERKSAEFLANSDGLPIEDQNYWQGRKDQCEFTIKLMQQSGVSASN